MNDYFYYASNKITIDYKIDINELCEVWELTINFLQTTGSISTDNCTIGHAKLDMFPKDGYLSALEILGLGATSFGLSFEKTYQLDCSSCFENKQLYYGGYNPYNLTQTCMQQFFNHGFNYPCIL